ncbi:hypothetical protein HHI36_000838 [Cryptolaemus montrouzieri]|uniref:Uncharacterized protein n=1 Tax=Cryptolaemus montrouzieri TaxID=559131 RepID=A0ABD2P5W9_9CUCU
MLVNKATVNQNLDVGSERTEKYLAVLATVRDVNAAMMGRIEDISSLEEAVDLVYAKAMTVCDMAGVDMEITASQKIRGEKPPWKTRLQGKVVSKMKKVGVLHN